MRPFTFTAARDVSGALDEAAAGAAYLAGGTSLVDLMKLGVLAPNRVVDINALPLRGIRAASAGLVIGALERMSDVAGHATVARRYPVVSQALLASASPQLRNAASIGGNLLQRPRCGYFRDVGTPCNRREPGSGCSAWGGENRGHAILGLGSCVATHPSDLAVALVALDAVVRLADRAGTREMRLADLYRLPGDTPEIETELRPGELITAVVIPSLGWARRSTYVKVHDRAAHEFALASAAVALDVDGGGVVRDARVALGGVATKPWRVPAAEEALRGARAVRASFESAAALAVAGAHPLGHNRFKVTLAQRVIVRALSNLVG